MSAHVLLIEDDPVLQEALGDGLALEGYEVTLATDGAEGLARARERTFDVVVLDWMLPTTTGLEVCRALRASSNVPIVMLTARAAEIDRVRGLEAGADDYVVKPFSVAELVSRLHAILRRRQLDRAEFAMAQGPTIAVGGIRIDTVRHEVVVDGRQVELTPSEYRLLLLLAEHPGQVFSRAQIMEHLWRSPFVGDARAADAHVATLRRKLERDPGRPLRVLTVRGIGYKLAAV